jgi:flagellar export protein FliJ
VTRRFRLGTLERLRDDRLEEAGHALAAARRAFAEAGRDREDLAGRLAGATTPGSATPEVAALSAFHRAYLRDRLTAADAAVAATARRVEGAIAAWRAARADLRGVQALHQRYRATLAAADARRDQIVLDDLAAGAARRTHAAGSSR